jgi:hypothetical protein
MSDAAAPENRSDERQDLQTKNIQDRRRSLRATVLSPGYALDSTRHFRFRAREPVNQWALGDRTAHTKVGRGDLDHCIPENDVRQMNIRFVSMSGLPAAQLITVR